MESTPIPSAEISVGDLVKVKADVLQCLLIIDAKKLDGRSGTVEELFTRFGSRLPYARVRWHRRGNRGKEFVKVQRLEDLEHADEDSCKN